ncbi:unnamed protein product [Parnassius apollo]|uniref:(apollo) hypothetical protein n=1 Tax=Parnassius apollo TaxID=110799 RepID=A0A8S3X5T2_PARAO|nr:unnamed protein product [Parnassius apollo]
MCWYLFVQVYQTHWWRCNGPCQSRRPYFGIVRRAANRAPGPKDYWWKTHQKTCGGSFTKIKEPENAENKKTKTKSNTDITKYMNNNVKTIVNKNIPHETKNPSKGVLKDSNNVTVISNTDFKNSKIVITQNGNLFSPQINKKVSPTFKGLIDSRRKRTQSANVIETVRNIWANKQLPTVQNDKQNNCKGAVITKPRNSIIDNAVMKPVKQKTENIHKDSPPNKIKKIDDYFKKVATTVLKDVYGEDFHISQSKTDYKLIAKATKMNLVDCPICSIKVKDDDINRHLDECLNKGVIETLCKESSSVDTITSEISSNKMDLTKLESIKKEKVFDTVNNKVKNFTLSNIKTDCVDDSIDLADVSFIKKENPGLINTTVIKKIQVIDSNKTTKTLNDDHTFDVKDVNKVKLITKKINYDKHLRKSGNFVEPVITRENNADFGYLPSFLDDLACEIKLPTVKIEPGNSRDVVSVLTEQKCPCCDRKIDKPIEQHLDECLAFFDNNTTIPEEGASTSFANETIVIDDDDDIFDETQTLNATGTKSPCPCCLKMVEQADMNNHLDICLS